MPAGGTSAFTRSVSSGSLPLGLRLNAQTGEIHGKFAIRGTWNFTVTAQDSPEPDGDTEYYDKYQVILIEAAIRTAF